MQELIRSLTEAHGPSGFEGPVRDLVRPLVEPYADEISVDALGNLIVRRDAGADVENPLTVMVAAHMDEIGVMVTHISKDGFLRFTGIGGVFTQNLAGSRVQFANGTVGIIGVDADKRNEVEPLHKYFIDVGATSPDDAPVQVGDAATFQRPFLSQGKRLTAKSMDDRIGCAVAIEALRRLSAGGSTHNLYVVFSVQEEVGTRGAIVAANRIMPDIGIALDVTMTGDIPEARAMDVSLGAGLAIKVKDRGMISHAGLVSLMRERAEEAGIAYQLEVLEAGSTDARSMQLAGAGSIAGCISIPCRYVHSQSETVDEGDVEGAVQLLVELLAKPIEI